MEWKYGTAGDRIPVDYGDIWECGKHKFICADIQKPKYFEALKELGKFDCVWVDPPYNSSLASSFRTKAGVPNKVNIKDLLKLIFKTFDLCDGSIYMEIGNQAFQYCLEQFERREGYKVIQTWDVVYYNKYPCKYIRSGKSPIDYNFSGMDERKVPYPSFYHEMMNNQTKTIFDPCTGRGLVPIAADQLGLRAIGTELHPRRLAVTLDKLIKQSGYFPKKIGELSNIHQNRKSNG